jgi:hypothetical protein
MGEVGYDWSVCGAGEPLHQVKSASEHFYVCICCCSPAGHELFPPGIIDAGVKYGATKIFLKKFMHRALEVLREVRIKLMDHMATKAQALWRGFLLRRNLKTMSEVCVYVCVGGCAPHRGCIWHGGRLHWWQ